MPCAMHLTTPAHRSCSATGTKRPRNNAISATSKKKYKTTIYCLTGAEPKSLSHYAGQTLEQLPHDQPRRFTAERSGHDVQAIAAPQHRDWPGRPAEVAHDQLEQEELVRRKRFHTMTCRLTERRIGFAERKTIAGTALHFHPHEPQHRSSAAMSDQLGVLCDDAVLSCGSSATGGHQVRSAPSSGMKRLPQLDHTATSHIRTRVCRVELHYYTSFIIKTKTILPLRPC